jgi:DNA-binding protein Alba
MSTQVVQQTKEVESDSTNQNEMRITSTGKTRSYITYATNLFAEKKYEHVVLKAMGRAIHKTVTIAEIIKRRVAGLHQLTEIDSNKITDNKDGKEIKRNVSAITITLSLKQLDAKHIGYQPPIPESEVHPEERDKHNFDEEEDEEGEEGEEGEQREHRPRGEHRGRGRGGRGGRGGQHSSGEGRFGGNYNKDNGQQRQQNVRRENQQQQFPQQQQQQQQQQMGGNARTTPQANKVEAKKPSSDQKK